MDFRLLGALEAADGGRVLRFRGRGERVLLAALLLHANEPVSRERLIEHLWRGRPPPSATHSLEAYVSRLRRTLGGGGAAIESHPGGYRLRVEPEQIDAQRFEQLVAEGWQALAAGHARAADERLGQALSLWRGRPLPELAGEPAAELEAGRLEELRLSALEGQIDAQLALGRHTELWRGLLNLAASAFWTAGDAQSALELYQRARQHCARAQRATVEGQTALVLLRIGAWDDALEHADSIVASAAAHDRFALCHAYAIQAYVRQGRGEPGAREAGERALEQSRRVGVVPHLATALAWTVRLRALDGEPAAARTLLEELIDLYAPLHAAPYAWTPEVVWAFSLAGRPGEYRAVLERERGFPGPWMEAAGAACERDFARVAEIYAGIGARNAEAEARVHAARRLLEAGDDASAEAQLSRAIALYRSFRASRLLRAAEALLPARA